MTVYEDKMEIEKFKEKVKKSFHGVKEDFSNVKKHIGHSEKSSYKKFAELHKEILNLKDFVSVELTKLKIQVKTNSKEKKVYQGVEQETQMPEIINTTKTKKKFLKWLLTSSEKEQNNHEVTEFKNLREEMK